MYLIDKYWADSSGRRNGSKLEVMMTNRKRALARSTRTKLFSPGRPRAALRSQQVIFWELIKQGISSEEAGVQAGASAPVGSRWFREAGGMPPSKFAYSSQRFSGRYLCFAEREEIALYKAQHPLCGARDGDFANDDQEVSEEPGSTAVSETATACWVQAERAVRGASAGTFRARSVPTAPRPAHSEEAL